MKADVICHTYKNKKETTLSSGRDVSSLKLSASSIDSCENGTFADYYHKTNNVVSGHDLPPRGPTSRFEMSHSH